MAARPNATPPRVSVITIFYNAADFLAEAVESVLAQDYPDFELLLVDDGSTDGGTAIAQAYARREPERIRYLEHSGHRNRGMSASRNLGIETARGDLIAFVDADDRWAKSKLSEQATILDRLPQVDAVCGAVNYWKSWDGGEDEVVPTGHVQDRPIPPGEATLALYPLGKAAAPCPSDLMVRRSTAQRLGGFEESFTGPLQMYEDQAFLAKLYLDGTLYFASNLWLDYRQHANSCVADVIGKGGYSDVRRYFLFWFADYLSGHRARRTPRVLLALQRALLPYRLAALTRALRPLRPRLRSR